MQIFNNLNIFTKTLLAPVFLILLLIIEGLFAINNGNNIEKEIKEITQNLSKDQIIASQITKGILNQRLIMKSYLQTSDNRFAEDFRNNGQQSQKALNHAIQEINLPERKKLLKQIIKLHQSYGHVFDEEIYKNMELRHELVKNELDAKGPDIEKALSEIMRTANNDNDIEAAYLAGVSLKHLMLARLYVYKFLINNDNSSQQRVKKELSLLKKELKQMQTALQNSTRLGLSKKVNHLLNQYQQGFEDVITVIESRNQGIAKLNDIGPDIARKASDLQSSIERSVNEVSEQIHSRIEAGKILLILVIIFSVPVASFITWLIARNIINTLQQANTLLKKITEGNLTARLNINSRDELGEMSENINNFVGNLQNIMGVVQESVTTLAAASEQLSQTSNENRNVIQQQVSETGQVATAIEEMLATLKGVSQHIHETADLTEKTRTEVNTSRDLDAQALDAIQKLGGDIEKTSLTIESAGNKSKTVNNVVEVINSIAEQTNLLALNAAIEAARAGEQGRGFAVVADEVRTLAARTQDSTGEIKQTVESLIQSVQQAVKNMTQGRNQAKQVVEQAEGVDQALTSIADGMEQIDDMTNQIAVATEQQTAVASEVSRNIVNLNNQTVHFGNSTDQIADATDELARLASKLQEQVRQFKVS